MQVRLHAGQAEVCVARTTTRFRVVVAGRRWGKTRLAGDELAMASATAPKGSRVWYVAPTLEIARDVMWTPLKTALTDLGWLATRPNESRMALLLKNGVQVQLKSTEIPDHLRGRGLAFLVADEFADMDPCAWTEVLRPQLADTKAPALFIGTPKSFNHFYDLFLLGQGSHPDWRSWQFKTIDNPYIDPAEIENARLTTDPRTFKQEWEASFEAIAGRAYYAFSRVTDVRPVRLDPALPLCLSFDFNIDPACAVLGQRQGDDVRVWREVKTRHAGGEATRATARKAASLLAEACWRGPIKLYGDATGASAKSTGPSDHAVLREIFGHAQWCLPRANPHERDRIAAVNGRCQTMGGTRHLVVDPSCVGLVADLEQVVCGADGALDKRSNPELTHLSDCLGYWLVREWPARAPALVSAIRPAPAPSPRPSGRVTDATLLPSLRAQLEAERSAHA